MAEILKNGRPFKKGELKRNAGISLEPSMIESLDQVACSKGIGRSQLVSEILQEYFDKNQI